MALIYRIEAELPHGRAVLYRKISEAYLNSIDSFRKLPMPVELHPVRQRALAGGGGLFDAVAPSRNAEA